MSYLVDEEGNPINASNPLSVKAGDTPIEINTTASDIQQPVEIQSRYVDTFVTHNAVVVTTGAVAYSAYIECVNATAGAWTKLAVALINSAATATTVTVRWSNDGLTDNGGETILASGSDQHRAAEATIKGKYARIGILNGDASSRTITAYGLLQA